ncbi:MAG: phage integrase N-terminal SAM-like domain-containing protein [Pseudomonadota bacterium]
MPKRGRDKHGADSAKGYDVDRLETGRRWVEAFLRFHAGHELKSLSSTELTAFLNYLSLQEDVSERDLTEAEAALANYYRRTLKRPHTIERLRVANNDPRRAPNGVEVKRWR